ncbi:hypothetical protein [Micromonospora sp. LOL_023]|uniref:hypothetical protein n=1 Tax=Micromonospora sp. LOL_023 TaxID=3345418 RepID=UPI003A8C5415
MAGEIGRLLADELARQPAPPIGNLVADSIRQGRRRRRMRRAAATGLGMIGAALAALLVPAVLGGGSPPLAEMVAAPAAPQPAVAESVVPLPLVPAETAVSTSAPAASAPTPQCGADIRTGDALPQTAPLTRVTNCPVAEALIFPRRAGVHWPPSQGAPATPPGVLELLSELLPPGRTSGYAQGDVRGLAPGTVAVQISLDRGDGPGMIRLWLSQEKPPPEPRCGAGELCYVLPDGGMVALSDIADNCVSGRSMVLHRADETRIRLNFARCLAGDGRAEPVLTTQEALDIALDPRWGPELPLDVTKRGMLRFTELPWIDYG